METWYLTFLILTHNSELVQVKFPTGATLTSCTEILTKSKVPAGAAALTCTWGTANEFGYFIGGSASCPAIEPTP